ncbi:MAG: caspase family protein [Acidimicrobiia bacterium]|nr:caspase family protein [Acidimicrobiia bacterium]
MAKRALCVGINEYPRAELELKGCVNDAKAWAALLKDHYDFASSDVTLLLDAKATKAKIMGGLRDLLAGAASGDVLVFTNSSHGTYRADVDGDESLYDEALCPYDCDDNLIIDDELRELFADIPRGVRFTVVSDSCHSGSATRAPFEPALTPDHRRARFCNPRLLGLRDINDVRRRARPRGADLHPESGMRELLLSGCRSDQYSYDAQFGRKFHGAMTHHALGIIADRKYRISYRALNNALVPRLREQLYDQEPQLEGRVSYKRRQIFT